MQFCKTVTLRTRPIKNGMLSYYLDYYPGYRDVVTMKTIRHESLGVTTQSFRHVCLGGSECYSPKQYTFQ